MAGANGEYRTKIKRGPVLVAEYVKRFGVHFARAAQE